MVSFHLWVILSEYHFQEKKKKKKKKTQKTDIQSSNFMNLWIGKVASWERVKRISAYS